ncbi:MAG: QueT transporter family protein [Lachnospiraceae bacterium]|nr:QueT transporter family protein [Lachnospiraceae bacterium]
MKKKNVLSLVYSAAIAAVYVVLTMLFAPVSFGPIQFRLSEALTILPFFTPTAIPGLFVGCLLSNLMGGAVIWDVIFGSLATLLGAVGTYLLRRHRHLACLPPIISNTLIIPWVLRYAYGEASLIPYLMLTVGIGEILAVGMVGNILLTALLPYRETLFGKVK